jgi:hypothetical protein
MLALPLQCRPRASWFSFGCDTIPKHGGIRVYGPKCRGDCHRVLRRIHFSGFGVRQGSSDAVIVWWNKGGFYLK